MSAEILINVAPRETRAALLEGGVLQEVFVERASRRGLVGNVYKGRITRVLPGMQAAFIEVGLARSAFLHVNDIVSADSRFDAQSVAAAGVSGGPSGLPSPSPEESVDIRRLINPGDDIIVQVVKDPMGAKGARLTTFISLPSRYLVFMPRGRGIGISSRIEDEAERQRLREAMQALVGEGHSGGYIVRTAAEGVDASLLATDFAYLGRLWSHVQERGLRASPGELVHEDLPLALRVLRDELGRGVERVLVDDAGEHARMRQFIQDFIPAHALRLEVHGGPRPIFDLHGVEEEINRALERKVALKATEHQRVGLETMHCVERARKLQRMGADIGADVELHLHGLVEPAEGAVLRGDPGDELRGVVQPTLMDADQGELDQGAARRLGVDLGVGDAFPGLGRLAEIPRLLGGRGLVHLGQDDFLVGVGLAALDAPMAAFTDVFGGLDGARQGRQEEEDEEVSSWVHASVEGSRPR